MSLFVTSLDLQNLVRTVVLLTVYMCFYEALYQCLYMNEENK